MPKGTWPVTLPVARIRRFLFGIALCALLLAFSAGLAFAHANLVRSYPESGVALDLGPDEIRLWFTEPLEPRFSRIQLLDRDGQRVDAVGPVSIDISDPKLVTASLTPLSAGVYTVLWRVTSSVDGHATEGAFAFAVGQDQFLSGSLRPNVPGAALAGASGPTIPTVAGRWLGYLSMALLVGGFAFFLLIVSSARGDATGHRRKEYDAVFREAPPSPAPTALFPSALLGALSVGWGLALASTLFGAVLQAASSGNVGFLDAIGLPLLTLLGGTRYGTIFWARLLVLGLLLIPLALIRLDTGRLRSNRPIFVAGLGLSALLLLLTSLGGHAAADESPGMAVIVDWVHLLAASIWIGGLVALFVSLSWLGRLEGAGPVLHRFRALKRFSSMAAICVGTLGATGLVRAVQEVADGENLLDTAYGITLLVKLGVLVLLLGLGLMNLLSVQLGFRAAIISVRPDRAVRSWCGRIRASVGSEILLALVLLLATSVMVSMPPSRDAFGSGLVLRSKGDDLMAVLVVNPGLTGVNSFYAYLRDGGRRDIDDAEKVALIFSMPDQNIGETEAVADYVGNGHYLARGGYISIAGEWRVQMLVRRVGQDDQRLDFTLIPRQTSVGNTVTLADGAGPFDGGLLRLTVLVSGVLVLLLARCLGATKRSVGWLAVILGAVLIAFGAGSIIPI
ncbi:MAG: copper resistance protein CopC/CopD [Chloroflexi bacterium]|nr:copper resistance protein CopC/CopD [Chloroflexota bacterium]